MCGTLQFVVIESPITDANVLAYSR
jgi:hypothetical protein